MQSTGNTASINIRQIIALLKLRSMQLVRVIIDAGWRSLLVVPIILFAIGYGIKILTDRSALQLNIVACVLVYLANTARKDKGFLSLLRVNGQAFRLIEYTMLIILINAYAISQSAVNILYMLGTVLFVAILTNIKPNKQLKKPDILKRITGRLPLRLYELKYGVRQVSVLIFLFWFVAMVAAFLGPILPFIITLVCLTLLEHISYTEPVEITQSHRTIPKVLNGKMKHIAKVIFIFFLPQTIITLIIRPEWIILAGIAFAYLLSYIIIFYALLLRYADDVTMYSRFSKNVQLILFLVVSPLLPVSAYLLYRQYKNATCNLQPLLN
ncbi:MAG: hypothetical protein R2800_00590 [Flavipsychrobacter sp.]